MKNEKFEKAYRCGATGEICNCKQNKDGSFPCHKCRIGIEFMKNGKIGQLHDEK